MTVIHGDCIDVMAGMDPESVDAIVTDPPYGLEFMGKEWDKLGGGVESTAADDDPFATQRGGSLPFGGGGRRVRYGTSAASMQRWHQAWAEAAYRVAKPSAYLLAFGGTRTVHRMTVALEDAGWVIRDMLVWAYASGFPKSKASLKPAWEPIVMARKPGPLRMLAIDECRIATEDVVHLPGPNNGVAWRAMEGRPPAERKEFAQSPAGRWPANVILTDPIFDGGWDGVVGGGEASYNPLGVFGQQRGDQPTDSAAAFAVRRDGDGIFGYGDSGTYSRFFLIPKAARTDREPVLGGLPERVSRVAVERHTGNPSAKSGQRVDIPRQNVHPTVKPTDLMRHLVRLVTPTGGVVLDPFLGSGTTALAAEREGFRWIGIEREAEYVAIAEARLNGTQRGLGLESA